MPSHLTRREMLTRTSRVGLAAAPMVLAQAPAISPNERLNLAFIGVAGRGAVNLAACKHENVVALCDVDYDRLNAAKMLFPQAAVYQDFRKTLDHRGIDAVVISTPDHMHAIPAMTALRMGKHVYCEQPMSHTVHEARALRDAAGQHKVATQVGVHWHAEPHVRQAVEIVRSGALGAIKKVLLWSHARPAAYPKVDPQAPPSKLEYNLWIGPAPFRPYNESHCHSNWRWWYDFGNGVFGESGCLLLDVVFWALELKSPTVVTANGKKEHDGVNDVPGLLQVDYKFPCSAGEGGAVTISWRQGSARHPETEQFKKPLGVLFIGTEGELFVDGAEYQLAPAEKFKNHAPPHELPDSLGHHVEWLQAIRTSRKTSCPFEYGALLAEAMLLGNVCFRAGLSQLEWDQGRKPWGSLAAGVQRLLQPEYRTGWTL